MCPRIVEAASSDCKAQNVNGYDSKWNLTKAFVDWSLKDALLQEPEPELTTKRNF